MKKFLGLLLVLAMALSQTAALAQAETPVFKVLSNTMVAGFPDKTENNLALTTLKEKTGVQFEVEGYSSTDDYNTKIQLYIASNEMPDMWYGTVAQVLEWKNQGVIMPLTELFEKYGQDMAPYIYPSSLDAFTYDGELWGLPSMYYFNDPGNEANSAGPIIRTDWLKKLNLEMPETLDELHDVLAAFTNNDPDGNGKKDTYGMGTVSDILGIPSNGMNMVYNAFGITPSHWYLRDDKLVKGFMTQEFKDAVAVLRDWYKEGIIDPEFPVMSGTNLEEKLVNGTVGAAFSHAWVQDSADPREQALRAVYPEADLVTFAPVEGPSGQRGNPPSFGSWRTIVFSANCKNPELLMQSLNWFAKDVENWLLSENGIRGVHWDWDAEGKFLRIKPYDDANTRYAEGFANPSRIQTMTDRRYNTPDVISSIATSNKYLLENKFWGTVPAMADYSDLDTDVSATTLKVIQGELPIEELDAMQSRYLTRGGQKIQDEVNALWQTMQ